MEAISSIPKSEIVRVLLVEDNPADVRLIQDRLAEAGASQFTLEVRDHLAAGLARLTGGDIDVILLDLSLPDSHGLDTIAKVRGCAPHVPIVIMTGLDDEAVAIQAVQKGAQDYLLKGQGGGGLLARSIRYAIERQRMQEDLDANRARLQQILAVTSVVIYSADVVKHRFAATFVSENIKEQLGFEPQEFIGDPAFWFDRVHPDDVSHTLAEAAALLGQGNVALEYRFRHRNGTFRWLHDERRLVRDAQGNPLEVIGSWFDVTDRRRMEEALRSLALVDDLTSLYNRRGFMTLAEQQLKIAQRTRRGIVLLFADLDGLKAINDTWGHREGDHALVEVANLLKRTFREADIVARLGGDEFVAMPVEASATAIAVVTTRLQTKLATLNATENRRYSLSVSVGVSIYDPEHPSTIEDLLARADAAMYEEKRRKRAQVSPRQLPGGSDSTS